MPSDPSLFPQDHGLASKIARIVADRIIAGALEPGTPLRQDHVAEEFGAAGRNDQNS